MSTGRRRNPPDGPISPGVGVARPPLASSSSGSLRRVNIGEADADPDDHLDRAPSEYAGNDQDDDEGRSVCSAVTSSSAGHAKSVATVATSVVSVPQLPFPRASPPVYASAQEYVIQQEQFDSRNEERFQFRKFPETTQRKLREELRKFRESGRDSITMLLLGRSGVGKSSTINTLLGERVCRVQALEVESDKCEEHVRSADGVLIRFFDTPGFMEAASGSFNKVSHLENIRASLREKHIDLVLFVDRLDSKRVDAADRAVIQHITDLFGAGVWRSALLALTHAHLLSPDDLPYASYVAGRVGEIRSAIESVVSAAPGSFALPYTLIENSRHCPINDQSEGVLPDNSTWLPNTWAFLLNAAKERVGFTYSPFEAERQQWPWMLALTAAASIAAALLIRRH